MFVNGCYKVVIILMLTLFFLLSAHYANCVTKERENRHLFPLLGYLHGYKIGQNFALQLPPFVLSPVVIVPSVNQQQSVNIQKSDKGENYHEHGGTLQIISPAKLISNVTEIIEDNKIDENYFRQTSLSDIIENTNAPFHNDELNNEHDSFRQIITNNESASVTVETTEIDTSTSTITTDVTNSEVQHLISTTQLNGIYPTALYKNENLSTLSLTTASFPTNSILPLLQYNLTPPNSKTDFQNFSIKYPIDNGNNNKDEIMNNKTKNTNTYPSVTVYPSISNGYPYPNPWYNAMADKLSITTNPYTNNESPLPSIYDDRWQRFSSLRNSYPASDFRPLAGLYHDGFLHKTLIKKTGFIPLNRKYLYYN